LGKSAEILNFGVMWRRLLSFMLCRFTPVEKAFEVHFIGVLRNVDAVENRRMLPLTEIQLQFCRLASPSLLPFSLLHCFPSSLYPFSLFPSFLLLFIPFFFSLLSFFP
jgi:hypothetical protein